MVAVLPTGHGCADDAASEIGVEHLGDGRRRLRRRHLAGVAGQFPRPCLLDQTALLSHSSISIEDDLAA